MTVRMKLNELGKVKAAAEEQALIPRDADTDEVVAERLRVVYEGLPGGVVAECEHHRIAEKQGRMSHWQAVRDRLAPYGCFKDWCEAQGLNYNAVMHALQRYEGTRIDSKRSVAEPAIAPLLSKPDEEGPEHQQKPPQQSMAREAEVWEEDQEPAHASYSRGPMPRTPLPTEAEAEADSRAMGEHAVELGLDPAVAEQLAIAREAHESLMRRRNALTVAIDIAAGFDSDSVEQRATQLFHQVPLDETSRLNAVRLRKAAQVLTSWAAKVWSGEEQEEQEEQAPTSAGEEQHDGE